MLLNFYIKVSYIFTVISFIAESILRLINNTRGKFFRDAVFKMKSIW